MPGEDWSRQEVELVVADYLQMLAYELTGVTYIKAARLRALAPLLNGRSSGSIEFKRANVSAALIDLGFPYIAGYKPRSNYQQLLFDVVAEALPADTKLLEIAAADADRPIVVPELTDVMGILSDAPRIDLRENRVGEQARTIGGLSTNYLQREANNRNLGAAGEELVLNFERERLVRAGRESLASKVEHTSKVKGDHEGFDILSFDVDGAERLIEVKTTKYGKETPFYVSRNEVRVSGLNADLYYVYRLFRFRDRPGMYWIPGSIPESCALLPTTFLAMPLASAI